MTDLSRPAIWRPRLDRNSWINGRLWKIDEHPEGGLLVYLRDADDVLFVITVPADARTKIDAELVTGESVHVARRPSGAWCVYRDFSARPSKTNRRDA